MTLVFQIIPLFNPEAINAQYRLANHIGIVLCATAWVILKKLKMGRATVMTGPAMVIWYLMVDLITMTGAGEAVGLTYTVDLEHNFLQAIISVLLRNFFLSYDYRINLCFYQMMFLYENALTLYYAVGVEDNISTRLEQIPRLVVLAILITLNSYSHQRNDAKDVIEKHTLEMQQNQLNDILGSQAEGIVIFRPERPPEEGTQEAPEQELQILMVNNALREISGVDL